MVFDIEKNLSIWQLTDDVILSLKTVKMSQNET